MKIDLFFVFALIIIVSFVFGICWELSNNEGNIKPESAEWNMIEGKKGS